jgi:hypothetical protein
MQHAIDYTQGFAVGQHAAQTHTAWTWDPKRAAYNRGAAAGYYVEAMYQKMSK